MTASSHSVVRAIGAVIGAATAMGVTIGAIAWPIFNDPGSRNDGVVVATSPTPTASPNATTTPTPTATPTPTPSVSELQKFINDFASAQPIPFSVYVKNITTGEVATYDADVSRPSGSIYKLFVAEEAYRRQTAGELDFTYAAGGSGYTIGTCVIKMVRDSTNVCGESVRALLDPSTLQASLESHGYTGTDFVSYEAAHTSPQDVGLLLERLYTGGYLEASATEEFLNSLRNQLWTFRLPEGLPREPVIDWGSKTGDVYNLMNDSIIVWGEKADYIAVVFRGPGNQSFWEGSLAHRQFSGHLYNLLNGTDYELPY